MAGKILSLCWEIRSVSDQFRAPRYMRWKESFRPNVCIGRYHNDATFCYETELAVSVGVITNLNAILDSDIFIKDRPLNPSTGTDPNVLQQD
jgi:hypothetical protein